eukprot:COSAG01_NODE_13169_length_1625_cov_3.081913_2_plen_69_part_00
MVGDQTDVENDDDDDDGQKDLKRAELQQLLDRQFSADDGQVSETDANQADPPIIRRSTYCRSCQVLGE